MIARATAFTILVAASTACSSASPSPSDVETGPRCEPLSYIAGDACLPLQIGASEDATVSATDAGAYGTDASANGDGSQDGANATDATDASETAPDSSVDVSTACLTTDDVFVLEGDDFVHRGPPLIVEGGATWHVSFGVDPATGLPDSVAIDLDTDAGVAWSAEFSSASLDRPLAVTSYPDAQREGFQAAGTPGLSIFGDGAGCNQVTGSFQVLTLSATPAGLDGGASAQLHAFTATFEQHCEGGSASNIGCVHIVQ